MMISKVTFWLTCCVILHTFQFCSFAQIRSNSVAVGYGFHKYCDWEVGSTGFQLQITRKLSDIFSLSFNLSYVVQDLTVDPRVKLEDYVNKMVERRLTYLDVTAGARFLRIKPIQMHGVFYLGPSVELGSEYLFYGIINGSFSELNGKSYTRHEIGFASALECVFILKKRIDIRPRIEFRNYTTGSPCYAGFIMIGYEFSRPGTKQG